LRLAQNVQKRLLAGNKRQKRVNGRQLSKNAQATLSTLADCMLPVS
jgi:hypothetical protein